MMQQSDLWKFLFVKASEELLARSTNAILPMFETCSLEDGIMFTASVDAMDPGLPEFMIYRFLRKDHHLPCPRCKATDIEVVPDYTFDEENRKWIISYSCSNCGEFLYKTETYGRET